MGDKKCAKGNHTTRTRRLRKKYQRSDSERDGSSQPKIVAKSPWVIFSDDEDENAKDNSDEMMTENGMEERKDDDSQSAYLKRKIHAINQNGECDRLVCPAFLPPSLPLCVCVFVLSVFLCKMCII